MADSGGGGGAISSKRNGDLFEGLTPSSMGPLSSKETLDETTHCTVIYAVIYWMDVVNSENVS